MGTWFRVFGSKERVPALADLQAGLADAGTPISWQVHGQDDCWFALSLNWGEEPPLIVERWQADEEGIRTELNSWAAFLETCEHQPLSRSLMERIIQARQLFTIEVGEGPKGMQLGLTLARRLAEQTEGIYQVDGRGIFTAQGNLLVEDRT